MHVLGHLCPTLESLHRMRLWTSKPGLNLLGLPLPVDLSDNCRQALSKLPKNLLSSRACEGFAGSLASPDDEAACAALREQGWAQQLEDGSWQLQRAALQEIAITQQVCDPQPMCHVPEQAALTDLSAFQLCLVLQQRVEKACAKEITCLCAWWPSSLVHSREGCDP